MLMSVEEISIHAVKKQLDEGADVVLIDVRESEELENGVLPGTVHIPMGEIPERLGELSPDSRIIVICRTGNRSRKVTQYLMSHGFENIANMSEGMNGWAAEIDSNCKVY